MSQPHEYWALQHPNPWFGLGWEYGLRAGWPSEAATICLLPDVSEDARGAFRNGAQDAADADAWRLLLPHRERLCTCGCPWHTITDHAKNCAWRTAIWREEVRALTYSFSHLSGALIKRIAEDDDLLYVHTLDECADILFQEGQ